MENYNSNNSLMKSEISSGLQKIQEVDNKIKQAIVKADSLKKKADIKHSAGWSFGGKEKRIAIEHLQNVTGDMAEMQQDIIKSQEMLFEGQKALANQMRVLFFIGAQSLAGNRMVVREIKSKLSSASSSQLSEIAREELRATVKQLDQMQDVFIIQEKQKEKVETLTRSVDDLKQELRLIKNMISTSNNNIKSSSLSSNYGTDAYNHDEAVNNKNENSNKKEYIIFIIILIFIVFGIIYWCRM